MPSLQIPPELESQLIQLAAYTGRTKEGIAIQALQEFFEKDAWHIAEIQKGIQEADAEHFATKERMDALYKKWGNRPCHLPLAKARGL